MINIRICTLVVAITFFISGCSSNQKKYLKKLPDIPSNWSSIYEGDDNSNGWVSEFKDETLYGLIKEALENNKDLGIAFENVRIARARAGASLAPLLPAINVGAAKSQISTTIQTPNGDIESCLLYTSPSPRDQRGSRMPSSA